MVVYIDNAETPFGRMKMCHMMADTTEELLGMVDRIGVQRKWIQKAGSAYEHFDVCLSKREAALKHGAKSVHTRELLKLVLARKAGNENKDHQPRES